MFSMVRASLSVATVTAVTWDALNRSTSTLYAFVESRAPCLEFDSNDPQFTRINEYVASDLRATESIARLRVKTDALSCENLKFSLGTGRHWLWAHRIQIERRRTDTDQEVITMRYFGTTAEPLLAFVKAAAAYHSKARVDKVKIYLAESGDFVRKYADRWIWGNAIYCSGRKWESVFLPEGAKEALRADVENWLDPATRNKYDQQNKPYRRGYLFHGVARSGKTSMVMALAHLLQWDVRTISLADPTLDDIALWKLFRNLPERCILLLEDIDASTVALSRHPAEKNRAPGRKIGGDSREISLSGLLNAIDGTWSPTGYILIMTTNFKEDLDQALVGPGRIDYTLAFESMDKYQAQKMFESMYETWPNETVMCLAAQFAATISAFSCVAAEVQMFLMDHEKPQSALHEVEEWIRKKQSATVTEAQPLRSDGDFLSRFLTGYWR